MVEILDYHPGSGWQLTKRDWLDDTPPAYKQLLMTQTVDPSVYEMNFVHK